MGRESSVDADRIEAALAGLGPESRALVELSVIRDVADEDIASLLGTDESSRAQPPGGRAGPARGGPRRRTRGRRSGALVRDMRELPGGAVAG